MTQTQMRIESKAIGEVSSRPELKTAAPGFPVCRFNVLCDQGPASDAVKMPIYIFGGPEELKRRLAIDCAGLRVGEPVQVTGVLRQRVRSTKAGKRWTESALQATDVMPLDADGRPVEWPAAETRGPLKGLVVHCMHSPYEVYIGRGKDPQTWERGEWGNRYSHRTSKFEDVIYVESAEEAVARFKEELWREIKSEAVSLERLATLAGKTLGCWCERPFPCHGNVLAAASIWAVEELARRRTGC